MVLLKDLAERPGYRELLRELIRSQIVHLVGQLSQNGEECFFVGASKCDLEPYLLGSQKGLDYMQGFLGVQTGLLHYLQKDTETPSEKRSAKLDADTTLSKQSGCDNSSVSPAVVTDGHDDAVNETDMEKMPELHLKNGTGSLTKGLDLKGMPQLELAQNVNTDVEQRHSMNDTTGIVGQGSKEELVPKHIVSGKTEQDRIPNSENQQHTDNLNQLKGTHENVSPDNSEQMNKKVTMEMIIDLKKELSGEVKIGNGSNTEGRNNAMPNMNDSDNESNEDISDLECDESEFDEMDQEEIFPQIIKGFEEINKAKCCAKIGAGNEDLIAEKPENKKKLKPDNAELKHGANEKYCKMDSNNGFQMYTPNIPKVNQERRVKSPRACVESTQSSEEENHATDTVEDDFKVGRSGSHYTFRNKLYSLVDILKPEDLLCTYCKKYCRNMKELKEHEGSHTKMYMCFKCNIECSCHAHLRRHNSSCFEIPQFVKNYFKANPDCSPKPFLKIAKQSPKLIINEKPIETERITRRQSTGTIGIIENNSASESTWVNSLEKQVFRCNKCRQKFKFRISLKKHSCKGPQKKGSGSIKKLEKSEMHVEKQKTETAVNVSESANSDVKKAVTAETTNNASGSKRRSYEELLKLKMIDKKCPVPGCGVECSTMTNFQHHLVIHTDDRFFQCSYCSKKFKYATSMLTHNKIFHGFEKGNTNSNSETSSTKTLRLKVEQRQINVKNKKHIKRIPKGSESVLRNYKCQYCEKSYMNSSHLSEHIVRHTGEKNFQCSVCDLKMQFRHQFPAHKKKCEAINSGLVCKMIRLNRKRFGRAKSSTFKMGKSDKQGIKSTFKKLKLERRDIVKVKKSVAGRKLEIVRKTSLITACDATASQFSFVQAAVATAKKCMAVENSNLPRCNTCGKEMANISTLKQHVLALHVTGEKPFPCPKCQKRFPRSSAVKVHLKFNRCKFPSNSGKSPVSKTKKTKGNDGMVNKAHDFGIASASIDSTESDVHLTNVSIASVSNIDAIESSDEAENVNVCDKDSKGNFPGLEKNDADATNERTEENMDIFENNTMEKRGNVAEDYTPPEWLTQTNTPVPYVCSVCDERFSTAAEIVEHNDSRHTENHSDT